MSVILHLFIEEAINLNKLLRQALLFFTLLFFVMALLSNSSKLLAFSVTLIFVHNMAYVSEQIQDRITFFVFNITFFVFLLGKMVVSFVEARDVLIFPQDTVTHVYVSLFLSLLFVYFGYSHAGKKSQNSILQKSSLPSNEGNVLQIRRISKLLFLIAYVPYALTLLEKVFFVQTSTYINYYTQFRSNLPFLVVKIGEMSTMALFVFLATMPTKKECRLPTTLYVLYGITALGVGQRNQVVLSVLIILIYYVARNKINPNGEVWFSKKKALVIIAAIPAGVVFLQLYGFIRNNISIESFSFWETLVDFFDSQGGSVNLIGYGYLYRDSMPDQMYVFGPIINFLKNNIFTKFLLGGQAYQGHTIEMALYGNSFGQTITYMVMPHNYLAGIGMGSCYIAEAYQDFGYAGICLINLVYGTILSKFTKYFGRNVLVTSISFLFVYSIIYAPRDAALVFIMSGLNLINILTVSGIFILARLIYNSNKKRGIYNERSKYLSHH